MPASASPPPVAIIPARYGSTRLPGKVLADIGGRPMVEHVYRRAAAATGIGRVLVATDDSRVAQAVSAFGGDVRMTRSDHPSGLDRLAEVADLLTSEIVVNVQGDEPLVDPSLIDAVVEALAAPSVDIATPRCPITTADELGDPNAVKVVTDRAGDALYFSRGPIPHRRDGGGAGVLGFRHVGLYAYRRSCLLDLARLDPTPLERSEQLEQLRALESGFRIRMVETPSAPAGVDTPADLNRVRQLFASRACR
ncbi:MAG: 3-deoxy-manno-octulosonate cytidylyltransferase [Acidobacteria bacterium]|nr:3-deoxy-manno-octulosonate cytidylyltransferase [Acidobacteriota bacterium]